MNTSNGTYVSAIYFIIALAVTLFFAASAPITKVLCVVVLALFVVADFAEATQYPASARTYNIARMVGVALLLVAAIFWFLAHPVR